MNFKIELELHHKKILVCSVVLLVGAMITKSEHYIIDSIVFVLKESPGKHANHVRTFETCPAKSHFKSRPFNSQYSMLYWSKEDQDNVYKVRRYSMSLSYIFSGILADKYGGQSLTLLSLVISSSVMAVSYLTVFGSSTVFLVMVTIRIFGEGVRVVAWVSLAMQWSRPSRRTTFVGVMLASEEVGYILGFFIPKLLGRWQLSCFFFSLAGFLTACWWWVVCGKPEYRFTTNYRTANIPWRRIFYSKHFYILCLLLIHSENVHFLQDTFFYYLQEIVSFDFTAYTFSHFLPFFYTVLIRLTGIVGGVFAGVASDFLLSKRLVAVSTVRKFFLVMAFPWVLLAVLAITLTQCSLEVAQACAVVLQYCSLLNFVIVITIVTDSAPLFASTMFGITYFVGSVAGGTGELLLTNYALPSDWVNLHSWRKIFYIVTVSMVCAALPYLILSRTKEPAARRGIVTRLATEVLIPPDPDPDMGSSSSRDHVPLKKKDP